MHTPTHATWTRSSWIIHEIVRCLYAHVAHNNVKLQTLACIFSLRQSWSQCRNFMLLRVEHFVSAIPGVVFWNLWHFAVWIPWRCHLGAETCTNFICWVWFLVILCAFVVYCNCKNDAGIVECQRLKCLSVESFIHLVVITRSVEYFCVSYVNGVALYVWINGLKPFCVGQFVVHGCDPQTHREFLYIFSWKILPCVCGDEVTGEWRKLHNEELSGLYSLPNIVWVVKSRRMRWAGHVARMRQGRGVYRVLVGKPEEKRPLGRPRRRWEDNIKMDLQ